MVSFHPGLTLGHGVGGTVDFLGIGLKTLIPRKHRPSRLSVAQSETRRNLLFRTTRLVRRSCPFEYLSGEVVRLDTYDLMPPGPILRGRVVELVGAP